MLKENKEKNSRIASPKGKSKKPTGKRAKVVMPKMTNLYRPKGMSLEEWQIALRKQQAEKEPFVISQVDEKYAPGVYHVSNPASRSEYKVVYRGKASTWNFCSCYDFKTSQLGTCKHLEAVSLWCKAHHKHVYKEVPSYTSVYMDYRGPRRVRIRIGEDHKSEYEELASLYFDQDSVILPDAYARFDIFLQKAKAIDERFCCYSDALEYVIEQRERQQRQQMMQRKYSDDALDKMLTVSLYPYQKEGIRFAIQSGKTIIADEMGLGKTIQAIGSAEIYLREGLAESVLIVCPTSLKYQWKHEIEKFTGGNQVECDDEYIEDGRVCPKVIVIEGNPPKRAQLYRSKAPYKIVSYQAMTNDVKLMGKLSTDVLIMDEIQRMKNWDTLVARAARKVESRYAVLLSGTPLENKLEELYSTMELADQFCFGPYYKFRDEHILLNPETDKIVGYKNLNQVGEMASQRLIRRTKKGVQLQLPKRTDEYILVPMTKEQADYHASFMWELTILLNRYKRLHFMSEQDRRKMMLLLGEMRMVSDSTFILEQNLKTRHDIKIAEVMNLLDSIFENGDEKVVIFSEWERMTRLVALELDRRSIRYEYLCGNVPSKQRGELVQNFTTKPESRVFISTDAGSTGLNLQVASTLINLDLPWNPAILEQRIARIYRLGQQNPVQILNLVSRGSIESGMINKLKFKSSMFEGVLDGGADSVFIDEDKFKHFVDDLESVVQQTPDPAPMVEYVDEESIENGLENALEEPVPLAEEGSSSHDETASSSDLSDSPVFSSTASDGTPSQSESNSISPIQDPKELIGQGVNFFSGLAETLKSPEATQRLIDSIVEVDEKTGQTSLKIPVTNKAAVANVFQMLGSLFTH